MLALLLIEEDIVADLAVKALMDEGICAIRFRDPLRLIEAIQELQPDIVVIRHRDFPLHERMIIEFVRFYNPIAQCKILTICRNYDVEMNVTAIIEDQFLNDPMILLRSLPGMNHSHARRGSLLVAKAQRIMKE